MSLPTANLDSRRRWLWLAAGVAALAAAFALDKSVDGWLFQPRSPVAVWVSRYGDWPPVLLAGLAGVAGLAGFRKFGSARLLTLILAAGLLTGFASTLIRGTVGRTRPLATAPQGFYGLRYQGTWIAGKYEFDSFPSGHTAVWAGLSGAAWYRRRPLAIAFLAGAFIVGWSRIALGCHHFSDVTASMVLGGALGPWLCDRLERAVYPAWIRTGLPI